MPFQAVTGGIRVRLKVTPKARRAGFGGLLAEPDGSHGRKERALKIAVTAAPEGGKANEAVIALLAKEWGVAKSAISVVTGATDRRKVVEIRGPSDTLLAQLQGWLAAHFEE